MLKSLTAKSVAGEITELDAKETPNSVTLVWNGFKEAVWYNIYQKHLTVFTST